MLTQTIYWRMTIDFGIQGTSTKAYSHSLIELMSNLTAFEKFAFLMKKLNQFDEFVVGNLKIKAFDSNYKLS